MKHVLTLALLFGAQVLNAQTNDKKQPLFIDVHYLEGGKVDYQEVLKAHEKDLAAQGKHGTEFRKFWVDESKGVIYCLSSAPDSNAVRDTHREAHGLLPQQVYQVSDGGEALADKNLPYFLDVHELGANSVTAADVAKAHQKDLAVQKKHGVRFINYWVDEKRGTVICLSQAAKPSDVVDTHREAHGLLPQTVMPVKQGQ